MKEEKWAVVSHSPEVPSSPDSWRAILSRFERSGQSHRGFCLAEDLAKEHAQHLADAMH